MITLGNFLWDSINDTFIYGSPDAGIGISLDEDGWWVSRIVAPNVISIRSYLTFEEARDKSLIRLSELLNY